MTSGQVASIVLSSRSDGLPVDLGRDAVGGEHHGRAGRHLVELLDEDRAPRLEVGDDVLVVDDLLADVDRGAVEVERLLHGHDRAVDACAVAAGRGEQHGALGLVGAQDGRGAQVGRHGPESRDRRGRSRVGDVRSVTSPARRRLAAVPSLRDTTAEAPAPVRAVSNALSQWIGQLGAVWVEGQVTQFTRRPGLGTVFLTLRDPVAEVSVQVTCARTLFDSLNPPLVEGASVVVHARPTLLRRQRQPVAGRLRRPDGRPRRAARPARAPPPAAGRRGALRPGPQAPAALPAGLRRPGDRARLGRRARRARATRGAAGRRCGSRRRTPPCRASAPRSR